MKFIWKDPSPKHPKVTQSYVVIGPVGAVVFHPITQIDLFIKGICQIAIGLPMERPSFVRNDKGWRIGFGLISIRTWGYDKRS